MSRLISILITALLIASPAEAGGGPQGTGLRPDGDVAEVMARAESLYKEGKLTKALHCLERAQELLAMEIALEGDPGRRPLSNARQLLKYLEFYGIFAYGTDQNLDEVHDFLVDQLQLIAAIESGGRYAASLAGLKYSTWINGQVHRIGDFNVSHWADGQIHRLGPYNISYWADGRPFRIGGIDYSYGVGEAWPDRVASVDLD